MPASPKTSADSAIIAALQANNPFERPPVVKEQNVWGESFPDIASLNAEASDSVFNALKKLRSADSSLDKVMSVVLTSDRGVGKSHVIKRIRKRLQATGEGVFIYASADRYGDLNLVNALFQQSIAESLEQVGGEGVTQWQEIAVLMVAEALRANRSSATVPAPADMVKKFDKALQKNRAKGNDLVGDLVKVIRRLKPNADPYILRAIVWTLSEERGSFAVKWLAGEQLEAQDAIDLRLPPNHKTEEETNATALSTTVRLISLIGEYKSVLIFFDELDTIAIDSDGYPTAFVILDLVKRLFGSLSPSGKAKGIVILTVLLPDLWRHVEQAKFASTEKISSRGKPISLGYLNAESANELAALTLKKFYSKKGIVPPTPVYPLAEAEITAFGRGKPSPREALKWFAAQLNEKIAGRIPSLPPKERFEQAYQNALSQFDSDDLNDNAQIASALRFGFQKLVEIDRIKDQPIEGVILRSIKDITPKSKNGGRLNFKVVGKENGEPVVIGISVLQDTHGISVGAGFRRLLDTATFGLSRGCLVRSRERKIKRNWDSYDYYQQLIEAGGEWIDLKEGEIKPLLSLQYVYEQHEKFDLTIKRLDSFAFTRNLLQSNPLIQEILSRPEGAVVEEVLEGDELEHLSDSVDLERFESDLANDLADDDDDDGEKEAEVQADLQEFAEALSV